jgi:hypothetical protein
MGIANSSNLRGVVLSLTVLAFVPSSSQARQLLFSSTVTDKQVAQLRQDLSTNVSLPDEPKTEKVMGVGSLSDSDLKQWLADRVGYIVGESEKEDSNLVAIQKYQYPDKIFPDFEEPANLPKPTPNPHSGGQSEPVPTMVMANVGTSFYYIGKSKGVLVGYKFTSAQGQQVVPMTSPRVGIIKVGEGLFGMLPYEEKPTSIVNVWFRLSTLFHEAHHSDGNKKSLGFPHAVCPTGHPYYNYNACDREINGAYGVEAFLVNQVRKTCMANNTCDAKEAEILGLMVTDSVSRVLAKGLIDPTPEGTVTGVVSGN